MNEKNIRRLAEVIEAQPHLEDTGVFTDLPGFHMSIWAEDCGTPRCIGGWACYLAKVGTFDYGAAANWLGLDDGKARNLFYNCYTGNLSYNDVTPALAAAVLRNLADTGEVDWRVR